MPCLEFNGLDQKVQGWVGLEWNGLDCTEPARIELNDSTGIDFY